VEERLAGARVGREVGTTPEVLAHHVVG